MRKGLRSWPLLLLYFLNLRLQPFLEDIQGALNGVRFIASIRPLSMLSTMAFCYPNNQVDRNALGELAVAESTRNPVEMHERQSEVSCL